MTFDSEQFSRRRWLLLGGASALAAAIPAIGWPDDDGGDTGRAVTGTITPAVTGLTGKLVVVGGGMAGVTAAKWAAKFWPTTVNC